MMFSSDEFDHLKIPLENILIATNNFAHGNVVATGGIGNRYKGQLLRSRELIDIRAQRLNKELDDGEQMFWTEISMLSSLKHKNVVSLVGFCDKNDKKTIIYKDEGRGSLSYYLNEKIIIYKDEARGSLSYYLSDSMLLTWVRRLEISVGIAHALSYIHYDEQRDFSVIHRLIDSSRILLNDDWEPKLSYFECSMKIEASKRHHSFHTNELEYVEGYGDPTYIETKSVNHKSDIYSFGIVLFELLCGRKAFIDSDNNKYLAPLAITHYREKRLDGIIDWDLWNQMDSQSFDIFAETAYECLNEERSQRPNIDEIVTRLEKALELQLEHQNEIMNGFAHLRVPLEIIRSATNNFHEENLWGEAPFGNSYKGQLWWSYELIDIHAQRWNKEWDGKEQQFWKEISMLSSLKHKNVVSLVGFCDENDEKIIIIKLETRLSLSNYLSDPNSLTWVRRLEISVGVAHALSYIHYDELRDFSVIHRLISSGTVLLNDEWEPKLSCFECSMKIEASERHHSFHTNKLQYVYGYGDPTYTETKSVNHKSDIYSFGIVLFELLCGRESIIDSDNNKYLAPLAITHYREKRLDGIIDWYLWNQMDSQSFDIFAETAYACLNEERSQRPNIDEIVTRLEKVLELQLEHQNKIMKEFAHLRVRLENILSATNNFAQENFGGEAYFGNHYKGQLLWSGELIDIHAKRWNKVCDDEKEQQFWTEISMLYSLKHKNMVSLVGFCNDNDEKIIIYRDEMARGSLSQYLSDPMLLTWVRRLKISVGIAQALSYIQYDEPRDFSVIHRNINSATVLLNDDWEPKLSDFERSKKIKASLRHNSVYTHTVEYTNGYGDPTYIETKSVNHKSDIYSFGIVLFELLCGRKSVIDNQDNKYLVPVVLFHHREKILNDIIDPILWKQMDPQSLKLFVETAHDCLNEEQSQRPSIDEIVPRLEKALELQLERENALNEHSIVAADTASTHQKLSR